MHLALAGPSLYKFQLEAHCAWQMGKMPVGSGILLQQYVKRTCATVFGLRLSEAKNVPTRGPQIQPTGRLFAQDATTKFPSSTTSDYEYAAPPVASAGGDEASYSPVCLVLGHTVQIEPRFWADVPAA